MALFNSENQRSGILYALAAYGTWGLIPLYFKQLAFVSPLEILCHRIIWTLPFVAAIIVIRRRMVALRLSLTRQVMGRLLLSALLISANWLTYVYAVVTDQLLDVSLGYYINPLVNVFLGMLFFRERLGKLQTLAVLLALAGTLNQALLLGRLPWISLTLPLTFAGYGLIRKTTPVESLGGLFVETAYLAPPAMLYLGYLAAKGQMAFGATGPGPALFIMLSGVVTGVPLLAFAGAARRLRFSTLGLCQYVSPTTTFLLAIFVYREPFSSGNMLTFLLIWSGLGLYVTHSLSHRADAA